MSDVPDTLGHENILDETKALQKGKERMLAAMIAAALAAVAFFAWYVVQDQPNPYGELGKQLNGMRSAHFEKFWTCVLPNHRLDTLKNDRDVREALHTRAVAAGPYGKHLNDRCKPHLKDLGVNLRALLPPDDAAPSVKGMADAAATLQAGVDAYSLHLTSLTEGYEKEAGEGQMEQLVRGWYEFKKAHGEANKLIKSKLGR